MTAQVCLDNFRKRLSKIKITLPEFEESRRLKSLLRALDDAITSISRYAFSSVEEKRISTIKEMDECIDSIKKLLDENKCEAESRNNHLYKLQQIKKSVVTCPTISELILSETTFLQFYSQSIEELEDDTSVLMMSDFVAPKTEDEEVIEKDTEVIGNLKSHIDNSKMWKVMTLWGRKTGLLGDYECAFCRHFSDMVTSESYSIRDANLANKLLVVAAKSGFNFFE